jgi:hypothetical protein
MTAAVLIWILGLLTAVPYAAWHLLFDAPREQYALLITFILFWIVGYWSVVGPLVMIAKVRLIWRRLEQAANQDRRRELLLSPESKDVAIDVIAAETRLPKFLARRVYDRVVQRLMVQQAGRR